MLPVACYVACSTYRIFPALCNAGVGGGVCVRGGGEPFALASGHCKSHTHTKGLVLGTGPGEKSPIVSTRGD